MRRTRRRPEALPPALSIDLPQGAVEVRLRVHPRARRLTLRLVSGTGRVSATLPPGVDLAEARRFLLRQSDWLAERVAAQPARTPLADGAVVPLRGVPHRIAHRPAVRGAVWVEAAANGPVIAVAGALAHLPRRVADFLGREARRDLAAAVARHAAGLGVASPNALRVGDPRSRWGSCSARRTLSFSWRIVLAPPDVLDYVAAHEVAHLVEMNHGPRFWALVARLCPGHEAARRWLKANGAALHAVV